MDGSARPNRESAMTGWPHAASPFHPGERAIQQRVGVRERVEEGGRRLIRDFLPEQHREFYASLPFLFLGTIDAAGQPIPTIVTGKPGFAFSPHPKTLRITIDQTHAKAFEIGADVGALGIDFATRRRNRVNGVISAIDRDHVELAVTQAYGNCPKYISLRRWAEAPAGPALLASDSKVLGDAERAIIAAADTFFIVSAFGSGSIDPSRGVDASHRGGEAGFVRIEDERTLAVPDFVGNFAFNTLGNLLLEPRCGLLFPEFATGTTREIAARADIIWEGPDVASIAGAQRLLRFHVARARRIEGALPLRWSPI